MRKIPEGAEVVFSQSIGFSFRYRANSSKKFPGESKKGYDDTLEQTFEVEGKGYETYDEMILAAKKARNDVGLLLGEGRVS